MRSLLINTCGAEGVLALGEKDQVVEEEWLPGRSSSEALLAVLRRLMASQGWEIRGLRAVGVVAGPGSFTGVRVGLAAAKGICEASGAGMVVMSRLALVAGAQGVAVLDAGRGEYYCGAESVAERMVDGEEIQRISLDSRMVSCEEKVVKCLDIPVKLVREPGGGEMLAMLRRRVAAGDWSDAAEADANYLRRTDAELLGKARAAE